MKKYTLLLIGILFVFSCNQSSKDKNNDTNDDSPIEYTQEQKIALAKEVMNLIPAGEEHQIFKTITGTWKFKAKVKSPDGTDVFIGEGITKNKMILGDRFLHSESVDDNEKQLAVGLMILGFNRQTNFYEVTLYSDGGTYNVSSKGIVQKQESKQIIETKGSRFDTILKVDEDYEVSIDFISESYYTITLRFKDIYSSSTFSEVLIEYKRTDEKV
ncbi:DUF1579 family protein [uncultured Psychroserpens sp.]|uniref:DUF1579 family protein n=1 Tax=uncultured Psychroserpens sp. TaxID=255436 RepID=UPI00260A227F|nr:DUF1579 family protein [uncultured Psychroserpens sp.]